MEARPALSRTSRERSFLVEATGVERVREDACEDVRELAPVEDDDAPAALCGLSEGRRPVLLEEPKAGIVRGRAKKPLGRVSPLPEERTEKPLPEFVARRTAVCFSYRVCVPPKPGDTATRARSADASRCKTSRVVEMAMSTRMSERNKENEHRVSNAETCPPSARTRLKQSGQNTKRKGLETAVAVPSSKRSTRATGRESTPRLHRGPAAVAIHAESPYRSLAEAFLRASSVDAETPTPRPAGANGNEDASRAYPPAFAAADDPMDIDIDGDDDIDAVVSTLRSKAVVAAALDDASRAPGDGSASPSANLAGAFEPHRAFAVLERAEPFPFRFGDVGRLMDAKHGPVGVAADDPAREPAGSHGMEGLADALSWFPDEHGFQEGFFRDFRAETRGAARFEAFERETRAEKFLAR